MRFVFSAFVTLLASSSVLSSAIPSSPSTDLVARGDGEVAPLHRRTTGASFSEDILSRALESDVFSARELIGEHDLELLALRHLYENVQLERRDDESALEVRNPGPILARIAVQAIKVIVKSIRAEIEADKARRGEFTKHFITKARETFPEFNWVICHTRHEHRFDGIRNEDWGHNHVEFDVKIGGTIGYEVYWFFSGEFWRHGDGGFLNWAFGGAVIEQNNGGKHLKFARIQ